jgi:hypothetical protein
MGIMEERDLWMVLGRCWIATSPTFLPANLTPWTWELTPFSLPHVGLRGDEVYIYCNVNNIVLCSIREYDREGLRTLKFFENDMEVLPLEAGELSGLESLQVMVFVHGEGVVVVHTHHQEQGASVQCSRQHKILTKGDISLPWLPVVS